MNFSLRTRIVVNSATMYAAGKISGSKLGSRALDRFGRILTANHGEKVDSFLSFKNLAFLSFIPSSGSTTIHIYKDYDTGGLRQMAALGLSLRAARMRYDALRLLRSGQVVEFNKVFDGQTASLDLRGADLSGLSLTEDIPLMYVNRVIPRASNLSGANLAGANLIGTTLNYVDFTDADLTGAKLRGAFCIGANFNSARLTGADLTAVYAEGASFVGAELFGSRFNRANLANADLTGAPLRGVDLRKAHFDNTQFTIAPPEISPETVR